MVFDFRHRDVEGHWKSSGHCKGIDRDAAFAILDEKCGGMPPGRYMSRPRDGRARNWDLFIWPRADSPSAEPQPALSDATSD
jgi:hypothetical protein